MTSSYILYCSAVVLALALFFCICAYNRLVLLKQRQMSAFSQIDVQLKRRHDLIPNLVQSVKLYMRHERETLEALAKARERAGSALATGLTPTNITALQAVSGAELTVSRVLTSLLGIVENYPDLKASLNTSELMEELRSTENKIAFARQHYNDSVARYNSYRESFPVNMLAAGFGFYQAGLLEFEGSAFRSTPAVSLSGS